MQEKVNKRPNLFLVGFQKCGSSSLFDLLISHPEIDGTFPKETFMLCDEDFEMYSRKIHKFKKNNWDSYVKRENPNSKYILEGTVCNVTQSYALKYIKAINNSKVLFIVRDPIDRFKSTYHYNRSWLIKEFGTISINEYYEKVKEGVIKHDMCYRALTSGKYTEHINRWKSELGDENVLVLGLKELKEDHNAVANKLALFLEIERGFKPSDYPANVTEKIASSKLHLIVLSIAKLLPNQLNKSLLIKTYSWLNRQLQRFTQLNKDQLNPRITSALKKYFKDEYEQYGELF
jgi:hypothetical protein